jgi:peptide chain release factor 1
MRREKPGPRLRRLRQAGLAPQRAAFQTDAMTLPHARLAQVLDRFEEIEARMGAATDAAEIIRLAKEHAELRPVAQAVRALLTQRRDLADARQMADDETGDPELRALADAEAVALAEQVPALEREVQMRLLPKDKDENASVVLEVRAGAGGEEAALFAGVLFRMYQRYAAIHGWKVTVESLSESDLGGVKEVVASIEGLGVFGRLRFESGVHRVQRVPETEASGRIHTSAATVAVLPQPEDVDITINDADIRIDTMRASGAGGQHVNRTDSAVRITHIPTGIVVVSAEKSQHQNRAQAWAVLRARLYDLQRAQLDAARAAERRGQVGSGDRSERIRTYNFPQGRVTDHRINLTLYNLDRLIAGDALDDVIEALIADDQARKLAALQAQDA